MTLGDIQEVLSRRITDLREEYGNLSSPDGSDLYGCYLLDGQILELEYLRDILDIIN